MVEMKYRYVNCYNSNLMRLSVYRFTCVLLVCCYLYEVPHIVLLTAYSAHANHLNTFVQIVKKGYFNDHKQVLLQLLAV